MGIPRGTGAVPVSTASAVASLNLGVASMVLDAVNVSLDNDLRAKVIREGFPP